MPQDYDREVRQQRDDALKHLTVILSDKKED